MHLEGGGDAVTVAERRSQLELQAAVLLDQSSCIEALQLAAEKLYVQLSVASALPGVVESKRLPSGLAIAPFDAGRCVADAVRSAMFLRGIESAGLALRQCFGSQKIEVVYAGTGPFAALILPLVGRLPGAFRYTFIDCHVASIASIANVLEFFGYSDIDHVMVVGDATTYDHRGPIHLAITETMQRALTVEPQVAIARQLAAQLHQNGVMIPERIEVDLVFVEPCATGATHPAVHAGRVVDVSLETLRGTWPIRCKLEIPERPCGAMAAFTTRIRTYGAHEIPEEASGLTQPEYVWELASIQPGEEVAFWYEMSDRPGIRFERHDNGAAA